MNSELLDKERKKYNVLHKMSGFEENQIGYGRQLDFLLNSPTQFCQYWRKLTKNKKILDIGLGAGETILYFEKNKYDYYGIDISDFVVSELVKITNSNRLICCSASDIKLPSNSCDIVQHLDGFEHIPQEIELDCLKESIRISTEYVFHAIALSNAYWDSFLEREGFDAAHINIKKPEEWIDFFNKNLDLGYKIFFSEVINETLYIILKVNK